MTANSLMISPVQFPAGGAGGGGGASSATATQWRLRFPTIREASSFSDVGVAEVMFLENPGDGAQPGSGTGATDATVIVGPAANAFDGNTSTELVIRAPTPSQFISFTFDSEQTISAVSIRCRGSFPLNIFKELVVEYNDGGGWTEIAHYYGVPDWSGGETRVFSFADTEEDEPGGHRYWRFAVTANHGSNPSTAVEIEFLNGGDNLTSQWQSTITDGIIANSQARVAFNGVVSGDSFCNFGNVTVPARWIGIDFGRARVVDTLRITARGNASFTSQTPRDGTVDYSDDGTNFTLAFEVDDNGATPTANEQRTFTA